MRGEKPGGRGKKGLASKGSVLEPPAADGGVGSPGDKTGVLAPLEIYDRQGGGRVPRERLGDKHQSVVAT